MKKFKMTEGKFYLMIIIVAALELQLPFIFYYFTNLGTVTTVFSILGIILVVMLIEIYIFYKITIRAIEEDIRKR